MPGRVYMSDQTGINLLLGREDTSPAYEKGGFPASLFVINFLTQV